MKTKTAKLTFQQGDVVGVKLTAIPEGAQKHLGRKRLILAHGESGHSHVIEDEEAELIEVGGRMLLLIEKSATVTHEEHGPIKLSPGIWEIGRVREYDPFLDMTRQVVD